MLERGDVDAAERSAIEDVIRRLREKFPGVAAETITRVVHHNHARFEGRPVRDFVPLFVERGARQALAVIDA